MDFVQVPSSPVSLDTLVSATVGAAVNLVYANVREKVLSATGITGLVGSTALTGLPCRDIEHPLLLSGNSNNMLMRELFPQSNENARPFGNRLKMLQNGDFAGAEGTISLPQYFHGGISPAPDVHALK